MSTESSTASRILLRSRLTKLRQSGELLPNPLSLLLRLKGIHFALFGGVLRDLVRRSPADFTSDIDVVVSDWSRFEAALQHAIDETRSHAVVSLRRRTPLGFCADISAGGPYTVNPLGQTKYGGSRYLINERWRLDVWGLGTTWAFRNGFVNHVAFSRLIDTTFFNWDAIAFDPMSDRLYCHPKYFEDIETKRLDINLIDNPNPLGNSVRALRYILAWNAHLSPRLASYVGQQIQASAQEHHVRLNEADSAFLRMPEVKLLLDRLFLNVANSDKPFYALGDQLPVWEQE